MIPGNVTTTHRTTHRADSATTLGNTAFIGTTQHGPFHSFNRPWCRWIARAPSALGFICFETPQTKE